MKRLPALALSLLVSASVFAQNPPMFYSVREQIARPGAIGQYESASRDLISVLTAQNADPKVFTIHTYMSTDLHYFYLTPIANFASIDTMFSGWMKMGTTAGDKWTDVMKRNASALQSWDDYVLMRRTDLSYAPATPRVKSDEIRFVHLTYYYIDPARMNDAEQVAKDWAALFKSKNSGETFTVYQVVTGHDLPLLIVADYAKDAVDFYTAQQRVGAAMPEIRGLIARAGAATRRLEFRDVVSRPDLSYPLPASK